MRRILCRPGPRPLAAIILAAALGLEPAAVCLAAQAALAPPDEAGLADLARRQLTETDDTVTAIAARCGFGSAETLRRSFVRRVGVSPDQYRRTFAHARSREGAR